ncbi:hypothetical protein [Falsiroseomonas selenitidurans]|uniref:Uncharacterized protein n=1 Tax=Falsiroseomonas selenitidurans TaxID=2716335 RepID=A0ABX1E1Y5_9PROT|nr:hypothetical protein [Falsiroseomonas selenitidurans]NKC31171.1 hypothetical protein [Falsiroseomonas selenitidurans]
MRPDPAPLHRLRSLEARLIARREAPPDPEGATAAALAEVFAGSPPDDLAATGAAIAAAVTAHGRSMTSEPAYHDRHHQAEATLCLGWLAGEAHRAGLLPARRAGLAVLAMAGHDLLHDGRCDGPPGLLEQRSATATEAIAAGLPAAERAEITRLILATRPDRPTPPDLAARLVREADLFGSLTPCLGWRLSQALAREWAEAGMAEATRVATHLGRLALLEGLPAMTAPAETLGLAAAQAVQVAALRQAGGAALLDSLPAAEAAQRLRAALHALGLPALPR